MKQQKRQSGPNSEPNSGVSTPKGASTPKGSSTPKGTLTPKGVQALMGNHYPNRDSLVSNEVVLPGANTSTPEKHVGSTPIQNKTPKNRSPTEIKTVTVTGPILDSPMTKTPINRSPTEVKKAPGTPPVEEEDVPDLDELLSLGSSPRGILFPLPSLYPTAYFFLS